MDKVQLEKIENELTKLTSQEGLLYVSEFFGEAATLSTSFGLEDQVISHMVANAKLKIRIFTIDTGRLFQETCDVHDLTRKKYQFFISTFYPQTSSVQQLIDTKGPNSFYESVDNRKECCFIRKVEPLQRALAGKSVWITGIRADQSVNRTAMKLVEWDSQYQLIKYNPILNWSLEDVNSYIERHSVPVNTLHKKGFPSIGCSPCTRAIYSGEDIRAGRWWWENSGKECGLHETKVLTH